MCDKLCVSNQDLVNIDSYIKFGAIMSILSQDIKQKRNYIVKSRALTLYKCVKNDVYNKNSKLDIVNMNAHLVKFCQFFLQILCGNEILTPIKSHRSVINLRKMTGNNPNQDLVNINYNFK